jgi:hypothetical protein
VHIDMRSDLKSDICQGLKPPSLHSLPAYHSFPFSLHDFIQQSKADIWLQEKGALHSRLFQRPFISHYISLSPPGSAQQLLLLITAKTEENKNIY